MMAPSMALSPKAMATSSSSILRDLGHPGGALASIRHHTPRLQKLNHADTGRLQLWFHVSFFQHLAIGVDELSQGDLLGPATLHHQQQAGHQYFLLHRQPLPLGAKACGYLAPIHLVDHLHDLRQVNLPNLRQSFWTFVTLSWGYCRICQPRWFHGLQQGLLPDRGLGELQGAPANIQSFPQISGQGADLAGEESDGAWSDDSR